ncbi:MAG: hypothetical protein GY833_21465 [Aestuariibacter sp.]|nr:hypothetical protein [Aestuariibacter sp.]
MTRYTEIINGLGAYIRVAKRKLTELVQRDDFESLEVKQGHVALTFKDQQAYVCPYGSVNWVDKKQGVL